MARSRVSRGDIWLVDLGMAQKVRPVLVLSGEYQDHKRAVVTYVPRTTAIRNTRFEIPHVSNQFKPGVFDAQGIGTVPSVKFIRKLIELDGETLASVEAATRRWLSL